jgi:hypothetical protein
MPEEMEFWLDFQNCLQQIGTTVLNGRSVQNAERRSMGNQDVNIAWNAFQSEIITLFPQFAGHKKRNAPKPDVLYFHAGIVKVVHIRRQKFLYPFPCFAVQTIIVIAGNKYFVLIIQRAEPVNKIHDFRAIARHRYVAGMYNHVGGRKAGQRTMSTVRVGKEYYPHN